MRANNNFTIGRILWQVQTIVKKKLLIAPIQHIGGNMAYGIFPIFATVGATIPATRPSRRPHRSRFRKNAPNSANHLPANSALQKTSVTAFPTLFFAIFRAF
jgi:hypothetical protein